MAALNLTTQPAPPYDSVFITGGILGTAYTNTTASGYRVWVAPFPVYVIGITIHNQSTGTAAGKFQAAYSSTIGSSAVMTGVTGFGESEVNNAQGNVELTISKSGVTDDEKPLLIPAGTAIGFNADASVTAAGPKLWGVTIRYRRAG